MQIIKIYSLDYAETIDVIESDKIISLIYQIMNISWEDVN